MAKRALAEVAERAHLGIGVVDALDHGELIRWATTGLLRIELKSLVETRKGVFLDTGHQLVTGLLDSRVQRDGEGELLRLVGKGADAWDDARGGDGKVPRADSRALGGVEPPEGGERRVVVGERLSLPHEDDASGTHAEIV